MKNVLHWTICNLLLHTPCWTRSTFPILFSKWCSAGTVYFHPDTLDFWLLVFKKTKRSVCTKLSWQNMHRKLCSCKIVVWYAWCRFHLKCFSKFIFHVCCYYLLLLSSRIIHFCFSFYLQFKFEHDRTLPICLYLNVVYSGESAGIFFFLRK